MTDNQRQQARKLRLHDNGGHEDVADLSPSERLGTMWQLACDAWALKGETELRLGLVTK